MIAWGDVTGPLREAVVQAGLDSVEGAFACTLGQDLAKAGLGTRRRTRLTLTDSTGQTHELFLKRYYPQSLLVRAPRLSTMRNLSVAWLEMQAIESVRQAGVSTMGLIVAGQECPLFFGRSYIIVSKVPGESLERGAREIFEGVEHAAARAGATAKLALTISALHGAGLFHRDLYACHIFASGAAEGVQFHLIDLARIFRPRWRRFRWRVKDLAQLHYSMPARWRQECWVRFLEAYLGGGNEVELERFAGAVQAKSDSIARLVERRLARVGGGK